MTDREPDRKVPGADRSIRFGDVRIDVERQAILRDGVCIQVEPKVFAVAMELLREPGRLVTRDALLDAVWGHRHVTPGVLTRAIAQLRQAMGDDPQRPRYIETRHGVGYRFVGEPADDSETPVPPVVAVPVDAGCGTGTEVAGAGIAGPGTEPAGGRHWRLRSWGLASAAALSVAITAWWPSPRTPPLAPTAASVAVLPFEASNGGRSDVFAAGLSMELRDALAGVPGLQVAAATAVAGPGRPVADVRTLGASLEVAHVLDGTVRRDADRLRVNVRLVDTATGYIAWSRSYDRPAVALFDTQGEIAGEVATQLLGALPVAEADQLRRRLAPTTSVAAFDAYLRGLQQLAGGHDDVRAQAAESFGRALALDSGFARAQAGLCRVELWHFVVRGRPDAFDNARTACLRAASMDQTDGQVRLALGDLYRVHGDLDEASIHYRAIEHDPALRGAGLAGLAKVLSARGDAAGALAAMRTAVATAPSDVVLQAELGYQAYVAGELEEAIAAYRRALALAPHDAGMWDTYGAVLLAGGHAEAARAALERSVAIEPSEAAFSNLGTLRYQAGDHAGAAAQFRRALALGGSANHRIWGNLGDALLAGPATRPQAADAFAEAATLAGRLLEVRPDDAETMAALGWYLVNTGDAQRARRLAGQATTLARDAAEIGEVALINADTYATLGDLPMARDQIAVARRAGVDERRIATNPVFRETGVIGPASDFTQAAAQGRR